MPRDFDKLQKWKCHIATLDRDELLKEWDITEDECDKHTIAVYLRERFEIEDPEAVLSTPEGVKALNMAAKESGEVAPPPRSMYEKYENVPVDELRAMCNERGISYHPNTGPKKLIEKIVKWDKYNPGGTEE